MLGIEVPGVGFNLLKPLLKTGSRIVGEGFGEVDGLGIRHQTWYMWYMVGGMVGWMLDGWMDVLRLLISIVQTTFYL